MPVMNLIAENYEHGAINFEEVFDKLEVEERNSIHSKFYPDDIDKYRV